MINRKLLFYKRYTTFQIDLNAGQIANDAIVFVQDPLYIWTHGTLYPCTADKSTEINNIISRLESLESSVNSIIASGTGEPITIDLSGITSQIESKADSSTVENISSSVENISSIVSRLQEEIASTTDIANRALNMQSDVQSRMVTLSESEYQDMVQNNTVDPTVYYFTYESGATNTTTWVFGGTFPVTFTDGNSSNGIGTFPINLV